MEFSDVFGLVGIVYCLIMGERRFMRQYETGRYWLLLLPLVPVAGGFAGGLYWRFTKSTGDSISNAFDSMARLDFLSTLGVCLAVVWISLRILLSRWRHAGRLRQCLENPHRWPPDARVCNLNSTEEVTARVESLEQSLAVRFIPIADRPDGGEVWFEDWHHHADPEFQAPVYLVVPMRSLLRRKRGKTPGTVQGWPWNISALALIVLARDKEPAVTYTLTEHRRAVALIDALSARIAK